MLKTLQLLGRITVDAIINLGQSVLLALDILFGSTNLRSIFIQTYSIGIKSVLIILVSGLFIGFVITLQGFYTLAKFSAVSALGPMVALSVIRELGPVITALLFAGRAGSAITSEVALMKTTEQLASLNMMGVDPVRFILAPKFWACILSLPILNLFFCTISIWGGYLIGVKLLKISSGTFWGNMPAAVFFYGDVFNGLLKSLFFSIAIAIVSLNQGYHCQENSEGIAQATTKTVVYSSLLILGIDFLMTALTFKGV